ncbi:hypothetical protein QF026_005068 [Streptomyces aurantiacus]|nr:hypothetical protein [Streptomyces aurantiacus]
MNSTLTLPVLVGAVLGLGIYALVRALMPAKRSAVAQVARIDAMRARGAAYESAHRTSDAGRLDSVRARVGRRVAELYLQQGWEQRSLRADLAVLDRSWENFLATKVLLGAAGLFFGPLMFAVVWTLGFGRSPRHPGLAGPALRGRLLLPAGSGSAPGRGREAARPAARDRRVPRPGVDEPGGRPWSPRGSDGGRRGLRRLGHAAHP